MQATVVPLVEDRAVLYRETVSGCYSRLAYGIGQLLSDQPFHLLNACIMFLLFYFIVGFRVEGQEIGYFFLILYLSNWIIMSLGQLYALATPNEESANGLGGLSVMLSVILMGKGGMDFLLVRIASFCLLTDQHISKDFLSPSRQCPKGGSGRTGM